MLRHRGYGEALAGAAACLLAAQGVLAQEVIRQSGFRDFARGTPGNSGANLYVSRAGRVEVINTWDLNQDGYVDLLLSNDHNVMETVDALIYWGSSQGYRSLVPELWPERPLAQVVFGLMDHPAGVTRLPSFGGGRSVIADLNRDGYPDIVFCNYIHNYPGIRTAYIYWGGPRGFQRERRTELPTNWASGVAAADLNGDGYPELVFANQGVEPGLENISPETPLDAYIYWGSATGFDVKRRTSLAAQGASDVAIADVNHDGFPDLAFTGSRPGAEGVRIFWGSRAGYSNQHFQAAPLPQPTSIRAADLDGDGFADLIVTTAGARQTIALESSATDGHGGEVYLLMGGASGVDLRRRQALPARGGRDSAAADFNHDGFPDVAVANSAGASYVYWGSKAGFSPARRTELPTLSANGVCAADLNGDGFPDLVFANSNDGQSYDVPSYIYWGSGTGFAPYLRASLQSFGAASVNAADLDGDGRPEILLVNQYSGSADSRINSRIFWGNPHHYYSSASMTTIPGHGTYDTTVADLNDDGFPDVVLSNSYADGAYVYWGGKEGFSTRRRATLTAAGGAFGSSAADLNRDGYLDLVFTRREGGKFVGTVLWGSAEGYSAARKTDLPLKGKRSLSNAIADLNRDGYLDLIFPDEYFGNLHIFWGGPDGYSEARSWSKFVSAGSLELADLNGDGYLDFVIAGGFDPQTKSRNTKTRIFWGTPEGTPSAAGTVELEAYQSLECAIADLDRDGNLDLVLSNYMSDSTRSLPVFIYWGSKGGRYSNARRTDLPAESSAGIQTVDLNRDGYPEIIVHNHLRDGNHAIASYIYWNGPRGFDKTRRTEIPSFGPHFSQMTDPGNLYTRKLEEEYVSAALAIPAGKGAAVLRWKAAEPHGARLAFQVRAAGTREGLRAAAWEGPSGPGTAYEASGAALRGFSGWLQYRAIFRSPDGGVWPALTEVEVGLR
ncbi:MAG TPA: VCBS repeat-containing protein [Bryobacteraceae bacterium]|nr:VCBS repeat-containing protein [Bryobacteraceae bacterium]